MPRSSTLAFFNCLTVTLFCVCVLTLDASSVFAQQGGGAHPPPPTPAPAPPPPARTGPDPTNFPSAKNPWEENELLYGRSKNAVSPMIGKGDNCFLPPLNGLDHFSVGVADLQAPSKAQKEQRDGCAALRNSKAVEAEAHLRKAVKQWPNYSAAWVVLGQVLESQQKFDEAYSACSHPLTTDSNYLPAYLCMADVSAHSENWSQVLQFSSRALEIDSTNNAVAYDYNAAANLHLHRLPEAEKSGLRAVEIDKTNTDPRVHFLLAQIYAAKGDRENEAAQLREYLKYASDPSDVAMVKGYLAKL
jgi:predicted Zn-dependent protease